MSRKTSNYKLPYWLSADPDCDEETHGGFLRVGNSLLESPIFQQLGHSPSTLYLCMGFVACRTDAEYRSQKANGLKRGEFYFPLRLAKRYGFSASTFRKYINTLIEGGYIERVSSGRLTRENNIYRMSVRWKLPQEKSG